MKQLSEGAEAVLYETTFLGMHAVAKERTEKSYREKTIDTRIRDTRTKLEARVLARAYSNGANVPSVLLVGHNTIIMQKIDGKTLHSIEEKKWGGNAMIDAGKQLALLHSLDIAHGDFTPANVMSGKDGKIYVIDFGLAEITGSIEEKALDVLLMKRSIRKQNYVSFISGYQGFSKAKEVLDRVEEIERRGRYQTRTLSVIR